MKSDWSDDDAVNNTGPDINGKWDFLDLANVHYGHYNSHSHTHSHPSEDRLEEVY